MVKVPPLTVTFPVPVPEPEVLSRVRRPALTVVPPVKVLAPERVKLPVPDLTKPPSPLMTPLN